MSSDFFIDLDELFTLKYTFKPLKLLLEKIIQNQSVHQEEIEILKSLNKVEPSELTKNISKIIIQRKSNGDKSKKNNHIQEIIETDDVKQSDRYLELNVNEINKQLENIENNVDEKLKIELNQELERQQNYKKLKKKINNENSNCHIDNIDSKEEKLDVQKIEINSNYKNYEEQIENLEKNFEILKEATSLNSKEMIQMQDKINEFDIKTKETSNFLERSISIIR